MSDKKTPETTIVTPTFNRAGLLPALIENVLGQTNQDFELIIVDDGSTDDTGRVMERYTAADPERIRYIRQDNRGSGAARNAGIQAARGKYVAFLDSDDAWDRRYLEKTVDTLRSGRYHWVVTACERIDIDTAGKEHTRTRITCDIQRERPFFARDLSVYEGLLTGNVIGETSRVVVTKQALLVVGGFRPELKLSQDYELWLRLAKENYFLAVIDEPLVSYRKSMDSVTKTRFVEALTFGYRIINTYCRDAIALDPLFAKFYARKMRMYARDVYHNRPLRPFFLIRCLLNGLRFGCLYKLRNK